MAKDVVRIAALGDIHYGRTAAPGSLQPIASQINDSADILVLCGDLTDYGLVEEAHALVRELAAVRVPMVGVLGNHDVESAQQGELTKVFADAGITILDGGSAEILGVGFAGVKGFAGGFGRRALGPWGEDIIKKFVHEAVDEALKLESALARRPNPPANPFTPAKPTPRISVVSPSRTVMPASVRILRISSCCPDSKS